MGQTAAKRVTAKNPNEKLAHRRMTVLELAERLGNVSEACRRGGIDRTSFYDWKRRFQLQGLDGLKDLPPVAKSHPMTTPVEVVARLLELALERVAQETLIDATERFPDWFMRMTRPGIDLDAAIDENRTPHDGVEL